MERECKCARESGRLGDSLIRRSRLEGVVTRTPATPLVIVAPSGYGKSVLARQVGSCSDFSQLFWIDCSPLVPGFDVLASRVAATLTGTCVPGRRPDLLPRATENEVAAEFYEALRSIDTGFALVLDDLDVGGATPGFAAFLHQFRESAPAGSLLVITTRDTHVENLGVQPASLQILDRTDLALTVDEARAIAMAGADDDLEALASRTWELSSGQPALYRILLRQGQIACGEPRELADSTDLRSHLSYLAASQLSEIQLRGLLAASLLRTGRVDDVMASVPGLSQADLSHLAACIPLVRLGAGGARDEFEIHDLAVAAYSAEEFCSTHVRASDDVRERSLSLMDALGRHEDAARAMLKAGSTEGLEKLLKSRGDTLLARGSLGLLSRCMSVLGPALRLRDSRLVLVDALLAREQGCPADALRKAAVARDLANCDGDWETYQRAQFVMARAQIDLGSLSEAAVALSDGVDGPGRCATDDRALALAYLSMCCACQGETEEALRHAEEADTLSQRAGIDPEVRCRALTALVGVRGLLLGDWLEASRLIAAAYPLKSLSASLRIQTENNRAHCLKEIGRIDRALQACERALAEGEVSCVVSQLGALYSTRAALLAASGEPGEAIESFDRCLKITQHADSDFDRAAYQLDASVWMRAQGDTEVAHRHAEAALEAICATDQSVHEWLAILETAASLLALGDTAAARTRTGKVREEAEAAEARYHVLRADMILAEADRLDGDRDGAVARLRKNEAYILSESSNWQIAMYVRCFPALLGVLASAIDPERLPAHLLGMVLPSEAEKTIAASKEVMEPDAWRRLAVRLVGESEAARIVGEPTAPVCRVRLFGGLGVRVGDRQVTEKSWRKRKARLVFAMLVLRQGRDVPRELLMDHLWPEMAEERARNNFYVVWSAMKGALSPEASRNEPCPYVENAGGVCRSVRSLVRSDIDEFDSLLQRAHDADSNGDVASAIRAYEELTNVYTGDLMPGDLYEDWFATARERYRHEFSDAMIRAAELCNHEGEPAKALSLVRTALTLDPWREDLYQVALRGQMACGQRSAAIDTYMSCRSRLADDLGIDPSTETTRLYEQVLAMEERASGKDALHPLGQWRDEEEVTDPSSL